LANKKVNVNFLDAAEKELDEGIDYYNAQRSGLVLNFLIRCSLL